MRENIHKFNYLSFLLINCLLCTAFLFFSPQISYATENIDTDLISTSDDQILTELVTQTPEIILNENSEESLDGGENPEVTSTAEIIPTLEILTTTSEVSTTTENIYDTANIVTTDATSTPEIILDTNIATTDATSTPEIIPEENTGGSSGVSSQDYNATSTTEIIPVLIIATSTNATTTSVIETIPTIIEQLTENGKLVTISSLDELSGTTTRQFINVPLRVEILEIFKVGQESQIKITWKNNDNQVMQFITFDDDGNGYIDHLEWIVPHL